MQSLAAAESTLRGASITAVGAPFGALAPVHFQGFLVSGVVSNVLLQQQSSAGRGSHSQVGPRHTHLRLAKCIFGGGSLKAWADTYYEYDYE